MLGKIFDKWRFSKGFVRNMWFFQTRNYFGPKFGQMAIFQVVCQKNVVFSNTKLFWAKISTNGDILGTHFSSILNGTYPNLGRHLAGRNPQTRILAYPSASIEVIRNNFANHVRTINPGFVHVCYQGTLIDCLNDWTKETDIYFTLQSIFYN